MAMAEPCGGGGGIGWELLELWELEGLEELGELEGLEGPGEIGGIEELGELEGLGVELWEIWGAGCSFGNRSGWGGWGGVRGWVGLGWVGLGCGLGVGFGDFCRFLLLV